MLFDCVRLVSVLGLETDPELAVHLLLFYLGNGDALSPLGAIFDFGGFRAPKILFVVDLGLLDLDWVIALFVTIKFVGVQIY